MPTPPGQALITYDPRPLITAAEVEEHYATIERHYASLDRQRAALDKSRRGIRRNMRLQVATACVTLGMCLYSSWQAHRWAGKWTAMAELTQRDATLLSEGAARLASYRHQIDAAHKAIGMLVVDLAWQQQNCQRAKP